MRSTHHHTDGDGWLECTCGDRHWGRFGAAGLLLVEPSQGVVLQHRSPLSHYGGTWALPGGARSSTESALDTAIREAAEEAAIPPEVVRPSHAWVDDHGPWSFTTIVATADRPVHPHPNDHESIEVSWVNIDAVDKHPLLPNFRASWPRIRGEAFRRLVLVIDAANVIGSRPDGWWRDRRAAATRLRDELRRLIPLPAGPLGLPATMWWPDVVMVTEGQARGVPSLDGVTTVEAPGSGDDTIVTVISDAITARPGDHVVAVTADRQLQARVNVLGAHTIGPRALRSLLEATHQW
jgi:8-oxo-dGTP pyrophosphatase MutT (NUDIX family)